MKVFIEELQKLTPSLRKTLEPVCALYGVMKVLESETLIFENGILKGDAFKWVRELRDELIS